jgi:phenylalanyl-tRNA synthetase beta subunit
LSLQVVSLYHGEELGPEQKSVSFRMHFGAADHTLDGDEVNALQDGVVAALADAGYPLKR